jgi:hypothetical protein
MSPLDKKARGPVLYVEVILELETVEDLAPAVVTRKYLVVMLVFHASSPLADPSLEPVVSPADH